MGFWKTLFGGKEETAEEKEENKQQYNFEVLSYNGAQAMRIGKTEYAIACLDRALTFREDEETRIRLAQAYLQGEDLASAADQYALLSEQHPDNASYPLAEAEIRFQLEQYDQLDAACARAASINDELAMPHLLMARGRLAQKQYEAAEAEATLALEKRPDYAEALLLRSQARLAMQKLDDARADIDAVVSQENPSDEALMQQAAVSLAQGQAEQACTIYNKVLAQNPFIPEAYIALEKLYNEAGQTDEAERVRKEAQEQFGTTAEEAMNKRAQGGETVDEYMRNVNNSNVFNAKI